MTNPCRCTPAVSWPATSSCAPSSSATSGKVVENIDPLAATLITWFNFDDSARAAARLQHEVERAPSLVQLRWLEMIYATQGERSAQLHILEQRVELEHDPARQIAARFRLAYLAEHGKVESADPVAICRKILEQSPGDARALDALERVARRTQNDPLLLEVLARQGEVGPSAPARAVAKASLASALNKLGRADEAQHHWHEALQEDALCRSAYENLKRLYAEQQDSGALLWVLERGLDSIGHPETMIFDLIRRSDLYWEKADPASAIADLDRVLELKPDQPNALERIETILSDRGDWSELIRRFQSAAEQSTSAQSQALICLKLGILFRNELQDLEQAGHFLSQAISADPDNVTALLLTADVRLKLDQPTEALALLNRVALRSKQPQELYQAWLGIARISGDILCEPVRARANIEMILEREPNHPEALTYMLQISRQLNDLVRQEQCLRKLSVIEEDPDSAPPCWQSCTASCGRSPVWSKRTSSGRWRRPSPSGRGTWSGSSHWWTGTRARGGGRNSGGSWRTTWRRSRMISDPGSSSSWARSWASTSGCRRRRGACCTRPCRRIPTTIRWWSCCCGTWTTRRCKIRCGSPRPSTCTASCCGASPCSWTPSARCGTSARTPGGAMRASLPRRA